MIGYIRFDDKDLRLKRKKIAFWEPPLGADGSAVEWNWRKAGGSGTRGNFT